MFVNMNRLGFGPKDDTDPEGLRRIADYVREYVTISQKTSYQSNLERLSSVEFIEKGRKFTEIMSFFFCHLTESFTGNSITACKNQSKKRPVNGKRDFLDG